MKKLQNLNNPFTHLTDYYLTSFSEGYLFRRRLEKTIDYNMNRNNMKIVDLLTESKKDTELYFNLAQGDLGKTYATGKWDIRKILIHLADAESVLHERIKRIIAEPKQVVWGFDQDLWCGNLNYESFPLEISKSLFSANRQSVIYLADKFYQKLGDVEFVHSQTGIRTLRDEFDKVVLHNQGHLQQIELALKSE